jgi:hypothetical protein
LIRHCIWHDATQNEAAKTIVQGAIAQHGYSAFVTFDTFATSLEAFKGEIEKETVYVKDEQFEVLSIPVTGYYEIEDPPNKNMKLLLQYDYHRLTLNHQSIPLSFTHPPDNEVKSCGLYNIRKGNTLFGIMIEGVEYQLRTVTHGRLYRKTRKPAPEVEQAWDCRVESFLSTLQNAKAKVAERAAKDAPWLRENLFVESDYAVAVETHVPNLLKEIEKKELDITAAQYAYKRLKNEEAVFGNG